MRDASCFLITFGTQFRLRWFPRTMPDVKNFHFAVGFADAIIDEKWAMQQLADQRPFSNQATHSRKPSH
jgi:hypothetical protein